MKQIDLYFDFISPFSYLAHVKLPALAERHGAKIVYHPIDIPMAKIAAGNYGPSNREVPPKIKIMLADLHRWAERYDVPLSFPKSFACGKWNTAALFAAEHDCAQAFVTAAYARIWGQGIDPADDSELKAAAVEAGLDADKLMAFVESSAGQTAFRKSCVDAHASGVFGAPIMAVGDEYFWGNDRLEFLEEYLEKQ
ncbi:MAG: 2-hydroxychromene-2-carboxylate isomerase [Porticoccaceae bacterium]